MEAAEKQLSQNTLSCALKTWHKHIQRNRVNTIRKNESKNKHPCSYTAGPNDEKVLSISRQESLPVKTVTPIYLQ